MIQLTGKTTYLEVSNKANSVFTGENFDWIANYLDLENVDKDKIYSGIAFFHWKLNNNLALLDGFDPFPVSVKVNGCKKKNSTGNCIDVNHKDEREQYYKNLRKTVFYE